MTYLIFASKSSRNCSNETSVSIPASRKEALGDDVLQLFSVDKNFILTILYHRIKFYNIEKERAELSERLGNYPIGSQPSG